MTVGMLYQTGAFYFLADVSFEQNGSNVVVRQRMDVLDKLNTSILPTSNYKYCTSNTSVVATPETVNQEEPVDTQFKPIQLPDLPDHMVQQVRDSLTSIHDLNWAWQFYSEAEQQWTQFDCTECLMIEFHFQLYRVS